MNSTQKESFGLIKLLSNYLISLPAYLLTTKVQFVFPKNIDRYFFVRILSDKNAENVGVALYQDIQGNKVIVKRWQGHFKDYNYYSIKNEASTYRVLNDTLRRATKYPDVSLPKLISVKEEQHSFTMIIEWIDGKTIKSESSSKKAEDYLRVRNFLEHLGKNIKSKDKNVISVRSGLDYLILFPVALFVALLFNFTDSYSLLVGATVFISYLPSFLKNHTLTLVHRDLHFDNIMVSGNTLFVIDLQYCVFTYSACEFATTLRYLSNDKNMSKYFIHNVVEKYPWSSGGAYLLRPMIIMLAVHGLTGRHFGKKILNDFKQFLKQGISMDSKSLHLS